MTTILIISIFDAQGESTKYKIRDTQDLGKLLVAWCQRVGKSYYSTALSVARTNEIVSLYDLGRTCAHLQDGEVLRELIN